MWHTETMNPWDPRDRWDALVAGDGCPLCAVVDAGGEEDPEGYLVASLPSGFLRLMKNQFARGYCVLVARTHAKEPHDLPATEQVAFFNDLMRCAGAVEAVYSPVKINYLLLGNMVPHVHAHLVPRYATDPAPGRALAPGDGEAFLSEQEYVDSIAHLRAALAP